MATHVCSSVDDNRVSEIYARTNIACITSTNTHTLSLYSNASQQIDNQYSQNTKFRHSERGIPC